MFLLALAGVYLAGFAVLAVTLWRVQVHQAADWKQDQDIQITRRMRTVGSRGRILDSRGRILAECRASRNAVLLPERFARAGAKLSTRVAAAMDNIRVLEKLLNRESGITEKKLERHFKRSSVLPLAVFSDLNDVELSIVAEHGMELYGFDIETQSVRHNPFGAMACHVLGYTGREIPALQGDEAMRRYHFVMPELKGRAGLESYYDQYLAGVPGEKTVNVNALGYVTGRDGAPGGEDGFAGPDLRLSIDASVQRALEKELQGVTGAGVVISCIDGSVIAIASSPAYDLNTFSYEALLRDPEKPLFNRAISGQYEPGSTFKPVTALAAGAAGVDADATYVCTGIYKGTHCANRWGHGPLNLRSALAHSCNTFFLHLADETGGSNICAQAKMMGLGRRTGIDLYGESAGGVEPWQRQSAIGQGMLQVTPLQMAVVAAAIANGGFVLKPRLRAIEPWEEVKPADALEFAPATYAKVRQGMEDVGEKYLQTWKDDRDVRHTLAVSTAAKTGTAERGPRNNRTKNTWMIAYAPADNPQIALSLVVENGESGAGTAGPRARNILKAIFGERQQL